MIRRRPAAERGHFDFGWLDTWHTFSFGEYVDAAHMGFRSLRVINEDRVHPGSGFPPHSHRDMEILTYVMEGGLEHQDSMGNQSVIRPGELQRMSAGRGVTHSEFNPSPIDSVHLLQIWILPHSRSLPPSYEQRAFPWEERAGRLRLLASPDGENDSLRIHQDARLFGTVLKSGEDVEYILSRERHAWIQVARGALTVNDLPLIAGDGAALSAEPDIRLSATTDAEVLLFDLS